MRFLSVAERELRTTARQKATYRTRWLTAALFFGLLLWLLWAFDGFANRRMGPEIFKVFSVLTFLYCLVLGTARTADCISAERRDGTLGLLFLTNLNSAEIISGKLCSSALASVYGLLAIFPMLALPLLMGGITFGTFGKTVLGLLNAIFSALAAGLLASVLFKRQFTAIAAALGLTVGLGGGLLLGAAAANSYGPTRPLAKWFQVCSPLYTLIAADGTRLIGTNRFWQSASMVAGLSLGGLGLTTLLLAGTWRDRPSRIGARQWFRFGARTERTSSANRVALRRRLLGINPLFWLAGRQRVSAPIVMLLALVLTSTTVYVAAPYFDRLLKAGTYSPVVGHLFAWLWSGLIIHALALYYAAMSASQRLAEDKQMGALELILSTPTTERTISRGLWLAYGRKMLFPAVLAILVHVFFIWMCLELATLDPPGPVPVGTTPGQLFWSALFDTPIRGHTIDWQFGFLLRIALLALTLFMAIWVTLGWVARWLGLKMKHPGFAPLTSLAVIGIPPVLLFSLACYLADRLHFTRIPERRFLPMMMWLAFGIGMGHCALLATWAAMRLRSSLRPVAMSRYQPLPPWRLPSRRSIFRFAIAVVSIVVSVASLIAGYYTYQNWHSRRAWSRFQSTLKQHGQPLRVSSLLPQASPDALNFARSPVFVALLSKTNRETTRAFDRMRQFLTPVGVFPPNSILMDWSRQSSAPLHPFANFTRIQSGKMNNPPSIRRNVPAPGYRMMQKPSDDGDIKRNDDAAAILKALQSQGGLLRELEVATIQFPAFQLSTNRDATAALHFMGEPILMLERLHLLLQVRACAFIATGSNAEAAEDVLAGLRLAQLARQLPDMRSSVFTQGLLSRSLQPLWEGLNQHAWSEPQLAAFQKELAAFNLLTDYTNAISKLVLAHIEVWQTLPYKTNLSALPDTEIGYSVEPASRLQPGAWWLDSCIQLHNAGRIAIENVDVAGGCIKQGMEWSELEGLPLDSFSQQFLQQSWWWSGPQSSSVAFVQTAINQAIIACALERYRLAHGAHSDSLAKLVPGFLPTIPRDAVSGRPMIYQFLEDGSFILRGVGPNGIDDRKNNPSDDWLWTYPTNKPDAKQ